MVVYKTTNLIDNKIYIGKDSNNNPKYLGSGKVLKQAIKKYGRENFIKEILEVCISVEILNEREIYWISFFNSNNKIIGYNLTNGGDGGKTTEFPWNKRISPSEETRRKISEKLKGGKGNTIPHTPWNKNKKTKPHTEETKIKMSESATGHFVSDKTKAAISKAQKDKPKLEEHKKKLSDSLKGRKLPIDTCKKMSESRKGIPQKKLTCPHCDKEGGTTMYRWHFDNCKKLIV